MVARFVEECLLLREIPTASQIHSGKILAYLSPNFNKQINYLSIYIFIHDSIRYSPFMKTSTQQAKIEYTEKSVLSWFDHNKYRLEENREEPIRTEEAETKFGSIAPPRRER